MSGLPGPFGTHFCPECGDQCSCTMAMSMAGPEEEEIVLDCSHNCKAARELELEEQLARDGTYKPGHSGGFPF